VIPVAYVVGAHALRGLLRVRPHQPPAPSIAPGRTVLVDHAGTRRAMRVRSTAPHGRGLLLVSLEGVDDRTAAEALAGAVVLVEATALPPAGEGEFYYHEVVGFAVDTVGGDRLGAIASTFSTGPNDVWVVRDGEREYLIPVIADVVRSIDRARRRVLIDPLPGLLE
jgi:16S rRNA processing protein RimM